MDAKQIIPLVTAGILGAVWLVMTLEHQTPPAILTQGIVAAIGSLAAGHAVGVAKKETGL
jgi:hypothetical protein